MVKCDYCGKEVDLPFTCPYCGGHFCAEHRLPESHNCPNIPKEPFWYFKKEKLVQVKGKIGVCPKCGSSATIMIDYNAETMTFECKNCGYKFTQSKLPPYDYTIPKQIKVEKGKQKLSKPKPIKKIIALLIVIVIIGVFIWKAPVIISSIQNYFIQASYTKIKVVEGQTTVVTFDDNKYFFSYKWGTPPDKFKVATGVLTYKNFPATKGSTYHAFGLEIVVSEVHPDYIILLVKPVS